MPTASERAQIAAIGRDIRREAARATTTIAVKVTEELRGATPVSTGHTQANWLTGVGRPARRVVGDRSPGGVARAKAEQERSLVQLAATLGIRTLYVTNNSVTASVIEDGNAQTLARPFVQRAIVDGVRAAEASLRAPGRVRVRFR